MTPYDATRFSASFVTMNSDATVAPPSTTAARRLSEQITALVDRQTRELTVGLALLAAEAGGYANPREAEEVRALLDDAIARFYKREPTRYNAAVMRGRRELESRDAQRARERAQPAARA